MLDGMKGVMCICAHIAHIGSIYDIFTYTLADSYGEKNRENT